MEFYPSISETLLERALDFAANYVTISDDDRHIILQAKQSLLFNRCFRPCHPSIPKSTRRKRIPLHSTLLSRTLTLRYACLLLFSVPVNFSLAFHNCKRNLIARSQNGDNSETHFVSTEIFVIQWRYLFMVLHKESGIIT